MNDHQNTQLEGAPTEIHEKGLGLYLASKGVASLRAGLSGGGDEGQLDYIEFIDTNGKILSETDMIENLKMQIIPSGLQINLYDRLTDLIDEFAEPLGDYVNNEGGSVSLEIKVTRDGLVLKEGYFTENEYDDEFDEDFEDDWDGEDDNPDTHDDRMEP